MVSYASDLLLFKTGDARSFSLNNKVDLTKSIPHNKLRGLRTSPSDLLRNNYQWVRYPHGPAKFIHMRWTHCLDGSSPLSCYGPFSYLPCLRSAVTLCSASS
jgi:hypothetical protein